ncbi:MAG: RNA polymerase sigma factor [Actinobacteria bacterium]|nr:RNA polymerase sigma factor [Actinomycetota bacterium]MBV9934712.1 RNA polymerase sigma factor [Actinomycetota bacterium]
MAVKDRAEDTFESWYRCHRAPLENYCARFLRDGASAADVSQEALLRAWTRRDQFVSESQVRPWLFRVARNLCIDTIRSRSKVVPSASLPDRAGEGDAGTPLDREQVATTVRRAMTGLSERHQALLIKRDVHGIAYDQLAAELGVTTEGARAVIFRARRCLQQQVERIEASESDAA